ncbi:MAG: T9SS type A sorting domain-containing protein [Flavobacteriaceae bacterium]|nr:T9SS type A sorting domain-containing protein [Flavobacteriaceae bacterium]
MSDWITDRLAFLDIFFANITLSVADNFIDKNDIKMYPNPAVHEFFISNPQFQTNEVAIYSLTGQKVIQKNALDNQIAINVSGLSSGIYLVSIKTDTDIQTKKLVIKRN